MADESLNLDLANKLREALGMAKREMKELYSMSVAYGKSLGVSTEELNKAVSAREKEVRLADDMMIKAQRYGEETQKGLQLRNLSNQISETANDIASEQNQLMADLVLKQTMIKTGLTGSAAEQAKNYKLLLDSGEITKDLYDMVIDRLRAEQMHVNHLKEELEVQESIAQSVLEIREEADAWKKSFTKIFETAKAIGRDPNLLGALIFTKGIEALEKFTEGFKEFKEMGLTAGQAINAQFKSMDLTSMDWWLGLSDTRGVMEGIVKEYGNVNALSKETVNELGKMAHHFGVSGEAVAKLNAALSQMPGETAKTAAHAMEHVGHMAELQGIAPGKIMEDMANNTEVMALYSKDGAEGFGKAAINLHKMGVEIGTAARLTQGLLNFEDSINKQMEASVLLGREISLDRARELALMGDIEGSTKEVLKNLGGSAEFDKMNILQKQALAEATGLTVQELQKAIDAQEEQNKYFGEGTSLVENAMGALMQYGSAAAGFLKENGELLLASTQFILDGNLAKMAGYAKDAAFWAAEKAHMLWKWGMQKLMGKGAEGATNIVTDKTKQLAEKAVPEDAGKSTGGLTKAIEKINPAKLLAGAAAMVLVSAAVFVFAKAAQEFASVSWSDIGKAVVSMLALVGAVALIGAIMMSGVGAVAILAGAAAMLVMSASLYVLGKAIQEIGKGFEILTPVLGTVTTLAANVIPLLGVAAAIYGIAGGLGLMAIAGMTALPVIGALIGLAAVAPALVALGGALGGLFEGGRGEESDKMDVLIGKIDELITIASQGGVVNMDGKRVGEVVRLGLNSSGVR